MRLRFLLLSCVLLSIAFGSASAELTCCTETEVSYTSDGVELAGALLRPQTDGDLPAAVVLQGAGSSDRTNGWARLVAETLVSHGVAVLLTDKRGSGASTGDWRTASFEDLARDALAGVAALEELPGIRANCIGLLGLSQGGHVAPLAASYGGVQFVINLVGGTLPMKEMLFHELEQTYRQHGLGDAEIAELQRLTELSFVYVESGRRFDDYLAHRERITAKFGEQATATWPTDPADSYWTFWKAIHDFDPMPYWKEIVERRGVPAFVGYGELDELDNVPVARSVERLEAGIESGPLRVEVYSGTGHSLMDEAGLVEPLVRDLGEWLSAALAACRTSSTSPPG